MVTMIHLSDLHFVRDSSSFQMRTVLLNEVKKAVRGRKRGEKLLIITGDFHNYREEGYSDSIGFLKEIIHAMDIDPAQDVFAIPGNHDVGNEHDMEECFPGEDWKDRQNSSVSGLQSDWGNPKLRNINPDYLEQRMESYKPYCRFVTELSIYPDSKDIYLPARVHVRNWRNKLNILHLNTTLIAAGGPKDKQLLDVTTANDPKTWEAYDTENIPALAIGHNHFYDLDKDQQTSLMGCFSSHKVKAYLCGDTHRIEINARNQIIPLSGRINIERPIIPNIVCAKSVTDLSDDYSDFGYYVHQWNEKNGTVGLLFRRWRKEYIDRTIVEGDDQDYSMQIKSDEEGDPDSELRDYLLAVLEKDKENHPSIKLMNQGDDFDEKIRELHIEAKGHVDEKEETEKVSAIILNSWKEAENHSVVITGEGGVGKTVALFNISFELQTFRKTPVIYIPLYRLIDERRECISITDFLKDRFGAKWNEIELLAGKEWNDGPSLLLLLDGVNEIPGEKRRIMLRRINEWSRTHPGTQLIAISRPLDGLDLGKELANSPISIKLDKLNRETIQQCLKMAERRAPNANSPIWSELEYPLFLILYIKTNALYGKKSAGYPLAPRSMKNGSALIWNFLQRELLRQDNEEWVLRCAIACEYILPYIAYQMTQRYSFTVSLHQALTWISECISELGKTPLMLPAHLKRFANIFEREHSHSFDLNVLSDLNWGDVVLQETGLLIANQKRKPDDINGEEHDPADEESACEFSFIHQNFRDCLAGLYLVNRAEMKEPTVPDVWMKIQDNNILNYIVELMEMKTFQSLWEMNRKLEPTNYFVTGVLLEIALRKKRDLKEEFSAELNFSGMDLRRFSLERYLRKETGLNLFQNPDMSIHTKLERETFKSEGHDNEINGLYVTLAGLIVSSSKEGTVHVWDPVSGECLHTIHVNGTDYGMMVTKEGKIVCRSEIGDTIKIWDSVSGKYIREINEETEGLWCIAATDGGRIIASTIDNLLQIWESDTDKPPLIIDKKIGYIYRIALFKDDQFVTWSSDNTLRVWDSLTGKCLYALENHEDIVSCMTVNKEAILSATDHGEMRVWYPESDKCNIITGNDQVKINHIDITKSGRVVSLSEDNKIQIWDPITGKCLHTLKGHTNLVTRILITEDGRIISSSWGGTIRIWDSFSGGLLQTIYNHDEPISNMVLLPNGNIVCGSLMGSIHIYDPTTGDCVNTLDQRDVSVLDIAVNKTEITFCLKDGTLVYYNSAERRVMRTFERIFAGATCFAAFPDRKCVSGLYAVYLRIVDPDSGKIIKEIKEVPIPISCVAASDKGLVVSGLLNGHLHVWNIVSGESMKILKGHQNEITCVIVLSDGRIVSGSTDHTVRIWDVASGKCRKVLRGHKKVVSCLADLGNGRIVSGSWDGTIKVWDSDSGECLRTFADLGCAVECITVLQDGKIIYGLTDGTIQIIDLESDEDIALSGHWKAITNLAGASNGKVISTSEDGFIFIHDSTDSNYLEGLTLFGIDMSKMDFSQADMDQMLKRILWQNGAKVSPDISNE